MTSSVSPAEMSICSLIINHKERDIKLFFSVSSVHSMEWIIIDSGTQAFSDPCYHNSHYPLSACEEENLNKWIKMGHSMHINIIQTREIEESPWEG